jgi:hypothetical protein
VTQHPHVLPDQFEPPGVVDGNDLVVDVTDGGLCLEFVQDPPDEEILACEREVLHHWYGDTPEWIEQAYGPWTDQTVWLAVRRTTGRVVAAARLIAPGPMPQRTLAEAADPPWSLDSDRITGELGIDVDTAWDVATINVRPELGSAGRLAASALYRGIFVAPHTNGGHWLLATLDVRVRRLLASVGLVLHALPGASPHRHLGSPGLLPVYAELHRLVGDQATTHPDQYASITLGHGLTGMDVPAPADFLLDRIPVVDVREEPSPLV